MQRGSIVNRMCPFRMLTINHDGLQSISVFSQQKPAEVEEFRCMGDVNLLGGDAYHQRGLLNFPHPSSWRKMQLKYV